MDEPRFPGICHLCDEAVPGEQIINHLRLAHPDTYERIPRWPDGSLAIAVTPAGRWTVAWRLSSGNGKVR